MYPLHSVRAECRQCRDSLAVTMEMPAAPKQRHGRALAAFRAEFLAELSRPNLAGWQRLRLSPSSVDTQYVNMLS